LILHPVSIKTQSQVVPGPRRNITIVQNDESSVPKRGIEGCEEHETSLYSNDGGRPTLRWLRGLTM
jgi:hypothetical protein